MSNVTNAAVLSIDEQMAKAAAENAAYEATTVAAKVAGLDLTIADLRKVTDAVFDPENWRLPWSAYVPHDLVAVVLAAVEFFHADRAEVVGVQELTGKVLLVGHGYQAW